MLRIFLIILLGIVMILPSVAQKSEVPDSKGAGGEITIRGKVVDASTQEPIIGATILVAGLDRLNGAVSRVDGSFQVDGVPAGGNRIEIRHVGYETVQLTNVGSIRSMSDLVIELHEIAQRMGEVVVTDSKYREIVTVDEYQVSARSLNFQEAKNYPAAIGDPARMAALMPGVAVSGNDLSNDISIRGNASKGILWRLEGVEIPSPNHFSGVGRATGSLSIFSSRVMGESKFLTGAFPGDVGNALAGVFDMGFRTGDVHRHHYSIQAGVLGIDVSSEGPFVQGDSATYLFNYRYSTLSIASQLGLQVDEEADNNFQDLSFHVRLPTAKYGEFSLFGLGGLSNFSNRPSDRRVQRETYNVGIIGLKHQIALSPQSSLFNTLSTSGNLAEVRDSQQVGEVLLSSNGTYNQSALRWNTSLVTVFSPQQTLEVGTVYSLLSFDYSEVEEGLDASNALLQSIFIDDDGRASTVQGYVKWIDRMTENLTLGVGLHVMHFTLNEEVSVEPRASINWRLDKRQTLSLAVGRHSRMESLEFYLGEEVISDSLSVQNNRNLEMSKANHIVLAYNLSLGSGYRFRAELYHQRLIDIPILKNSPTNTQFGVYSALLSGNEFTELLRVLDLTNQGTGRNYGLEVSAERSFPGQLFVMTNASLYKAQYTGGDGLTRNSRYDGGFSWNTVAGKEWVIGRSGNNWLGFSSRLTWQGGNRYIPIDLEESIEKNKKLFDYSRAYEDQLPDYFRFDVQLSFESKLRRASHEWRLDIQNVTDRENVLELDFEPALEAIVEEYQTGLLPVLSYRVTF